MTRAVPDPANDDKESPRFDLEFKPSYGEAVPVAPRVQRITVNNPGPFTFHGTNSYIVGDRSVAVIDPGPEDEAHFRALMQALAGREVTHIAVSHTHRDHSPLSRRLKADTGALIVAEGPHRAARPVDGLPQRWQARRPRPAGAASFLLPARPYADVVAVRRADVLGPCVGMIAGVRVAVSEA